MVIKELEISIPNSRGLIKSYKNSIRNLQAWVVTDFAWRNMKSEILESDVGFERKLRNQ